MTKEVVSYQKSDGTGSEPGKSINGGGLIHINGGMDDRAGYPETLYDPASIQTADASDNTPTAGINVVGYEGIVFIETVADVTVQVSIDGTTWIAVDYPFIDLGVAARTIVITTNSNTGPFLIETPYSAIRFLNHSALQSTITYARVGKMPGIALP